MTNLIKKIKKGLGIFLMFLMFIGIAFVFFSPILIALVTKNWWYLLLFSVTWIPAIGSVLGLALIIETFND